MVSIRSRTRGTQLRAEGDLRVLWLTAGRSELALSVEGVWLRRGRAEAELPWAAIQQLQAVAVSGPGRQRKVRIELFRRDGTFQALGPYDRAPAERWIQAAAEAAREHGEATLPLEGALGFALNL
jgi:hypothetical protein